ncbi:hypothetical protein Dsin_018769 [Dipteronia sinensis]|uniref:Uncharacterized protein n=1 Tax=Dipteronia sinensis TaxID=43782 RepID=A0AAE0A7C9_9ROSI|nr:hypothetical protein Dsin_018769 [Dipteronia sinensis]
MIRTTWGTRDKVVEMQRGIRSPTFKEIHEDTVEKDQNTLEKTGSPFSDTIGQARFSKKFRMPHVEQFKANTYPQEHVRRYQSAMAQYDYDVALMYRMFP